MGPVKAANVPPAITYEDCLRKCTRCLIGATNAKSPAKVKFIRAGQAQAKPAAPEQAAPQPQKDTPPEQPANP
jgi:hypothetical protein